jgi:2-polyprenyl-6-hydroxyphenyl methylase/3-demethylubiquinone-9 3-methyltransferase
MSLRWKIAQFFEARWWRVYLYHKNPEDYISWKKAYWSKFAEHFDIPVAASERLLDAGCGPAGIFLHYPENQITLLDPMLNQYRNSPHFQTRFYSPENLVQSRIEEFIPERPFDRIFCLNALNHVDDLNLCLKRLNSCLDKNGLIHVSVDAHRFTFLKMLFQIIPGDVLHPHQFDIVDYKKLMENAGFIVLQTKLLKNEPIFNYYLITARKNEII